MILYVWDIRIFNIPIIIFYKIFIYITLYADILYIPLVNTKLPQIVSKNIIMKVVRSQILIVFFVLLVPRQEEFHASPEMFIFRCVFFKSLPYRSFLFIQESCRHYDTAFSLLPFVKVHRSYFCMPKEMKVLNSSRTEIITILGLIKQMIKADQILFVKSATSILYFNRVKLILIGNRGL